MRRSENSAFQAFLIGRLLLPGVIGFGPVCAPSTFSAVFFCLYKSTMGMAVILVCRTEAKKMIWGIFRSGKVKLVCQFSL